VPRADVGSGPLPEPDAGAIARTVPITIDGARGELRARIGRHRRDHELHQHVEPSVMLAAGLLARKAAARGLGVKPWVKTSLAPGSKS
jgi:hypothetical protein